MERVARGTIKCGCNITLARSRSLSFVASEAARTFKVAGFDGLVVCGQQPCSRGAEVDAAGQSRGVAVLSREEQRPATVQCRHVAVHLERRYLVAGANVVMPRWKKWERSAQVRARPREGHVGGRCGERARSRVGDSGAGVVL